jgi:glycosyltransferase involved in cell wall biosynthesis
VVVPTLDDAHLLGSLVSSVVSQDYRPLELVVVDGGSRDDTIERLERMKRLETRDFMIRIIREADFGAVRSPGNARNVGVEAGRGDYIIFLDSDMRFAEPSCVRVIKDELDRYDFTKVLVRVIVDTETERYLASLLPSPSTHHCGYRRSVFRRVRFDPVLGVGEDKDFWFRVSHELGVDINHVCPAIVSRHLPHSRAEYLKQTAWYFRTLPKFASVVFARGECEYVSDVLSQLRYCAYAVSGPLILILGLLDWLASRSNLVFGLFDSTARRYVAAFSLLRGAIRARSLSFTTRLALLSLVRRTQGRHGHLG